MMGSQEDNSNRSLSLDNSPPRISRSYLEQPFGLKSSPLKLGELVGPFPPTSCMETNPNLLIQKLKVINLVNDRPKEPRNGHCNLNSSHNGSHEPVLADTHHEPECDQICDLQRAGSPKVEDEDKIDMTDGYLAHQMEKMLKNLPSELLQLCLARVPYQFQPRLRAVCKQWNAIADGDSLLQIRKAANKTEIWTFILENEYDYYRKYLGLRGHLYNLFKEGRKSPPPQSPYGCIMWDGDRPYVAPFEGGHPIPRLYTPLRLEYGLAGANGRLYVIGGRPPLNGWHTGFSKPQSWEVFGRLDVYDPASNRWELAKAMPTPRYGFGVGALECDPVTRKEVIIVAGGYSTDETPLSSVDLYDPTTDSWQDLPPMKFVKGPCRAQQVDNRLFVKQLEGGDFLEAFDLRTKTWCAVPDDGQLELDPLQLGDTNNNRSRSFASLHL